MSNEYFASTINLVDFTRARGAPINALSEQVEAAFDLLPASATFAKALVPTVEAGGTGDAITVANDTPIESYAMGQRVSFKATATNTGAATVNVDGLGAKTVKRGDGTTLSAGDITSGRIVDLVYDGTDFRVQGTIVTVNAAGTDVVIAAATAAAGEAEAARDEAVDAAAAAEAAIAPYTAADVLSKLLTVDGSGSGVDTDLVRGTTPTAVGLSLLAGASATAIKSVLALENVSNTSDLNKPVSTAAQTALDLKAPKASPVFTGTVTLPGAPTADNHAATKAWVEQSIEGLTNLQAKAEVAVIATSNLDLSGEETIDDVLTSASRVLVAGQTDAAENGIYVSGAGAWTRATDADTWAELENASVVVVGGTTNAGSRWQAVLADGGTLGTTGITWARTASAAAYTASDGITKDGLNFELSPIADDHILGNISGGSAAPVALTAAQVTALLDEFGAAKGLVPAVTADGSKYLGDGGWDSSLTPASVAASGTVTGSNLSGTNTGDQTITLTGDVTGTGTGSFATSIANNAVTLAKMATVATKRYLGRTSGGSGNVEALTKAQLMADLDLSGTNTGDQTSVTGNAGTATALATARTIATSGGATGTATSFNGTANITVPITALDMSYASAGTLAVTRGGTGTTTATGTGSVVRSVSPTITGTLIADGARFDDQVSIADGTVSDLHLRFFSDSDTGIYRSAANTFDIATGGAQRLSISTTAITAKVPVLAPGGSQTAPGFAFDGDPNTGIFSDFADTVIITCGGDDTLQIDANRTKVRNGVLNIPTGTPASAGASGSAGDIQWDGSYIYVCTALNTWKRAALSTW